MVLIEFVEIKVPNKGRYNIEGLGVPERRSSPLRWSSPSYHKYQDGDGVNLAVVFRLLTIPLWTPFVLILIPTVYLWYRDRRLPPGHCQKCGYDLTGNESERCPECGTDVPGKEQEVREV